MLIKRLLLYIILIQPLFASEVKDPIIASFGKNEITLSEFRLAYLDLIKNPKVYDSKELREKFLDELIERRLLSNEAKKTGYDKSDLLDFKESAYFNKCLREAHFNKVIRPQIIVEDNEVENTYIFTQEERRISHLFFESKTKADSVYQLLQNGRDFKELAKQVFRDTLLANSGGDLGWVTWEQLEYDLGKAAFTLPANIYSKPIKSSYGYHIIMVTDFKKMPMINRREYEIRKRKVKYMLEYKIGDKLAYEYIDALIKNAKVSIYPDILQQVDEKRKDIFKRQPDKNDKMSDIQLKDSEIKMAESDLGNIRNEVLAIVNGENLTVGKFIELISYIPYEVLSKSLKATLDYAIRDFLIVHEAKAMGLENSDTVKLKTRMHNEALLQMEIRRDIITKISVTDDELLKYFQNDKKKFKNIRFEDVKDYIKDIILTEKKQKVIPDYIKKLTRGMKIKKHPDVLNNYYDSILKGDLSDNIK